MDEILNILEKIDDITGRIKATLSETDIPLSNQLSTVKEELSTLIGDDAFRALNDYTEQFRNLDRMVKEVKNEIKEIVVNPSFERNFKAVDDVLNAIQNKTKELENQQLVAGDLYAIDKLQNLSSKDIKSHLNIDIPDEKLRKIQEKYGRLEIDTVISDVKREKIESFNQYTNRLLSQPSQFLSKPLNIDQNSFAFEGFKELDTQSKRLANAFSYFNQQLDLAQRASSRTTDGLNTAVKNIELAANRQLQFANQQLSRGDIDKRTFDLIAQSIQESMTRINAELPKELRLKILDEDILKSKESINMDTIVSAVAKGKANEPQLSPFSSLDVLKNTSKDLQATLESRLNAFTTYQLGLGHTNDPLSMMMPMGLGYQQRLDPAIQRFTDKIKEFDSITNTNPIFQRRARNDIELLLNQKLLEAYQLKDARISEGRKLYESGEISERTYNTILKESDAEFRRLTRTLREAQLSFNAIANIRSGIRPISLIPEDYAKNKLASGETTISLDEIRKTTGSSEIRKGLERIEAELYQGAVNLRNAFAKTTANLLMNTAWTASFTFPMALMDSLIFEPYARTKNILEPTFTGIGQATGVPQAVGQITQFVGGGFINLANDIFDKISSITAIYRNPQVGQQVIGTALQVARYQPIQFSEATELLRSFAVYPGTRTVIGTNEQSRRHLLDAAQYLQMLSPEQGVAGAIIALREFFSGEFRSMKMRFEIDPESLATDTTVGQMLAAPDDKKIEYLYTALSNLLGKEALFYKGANVEFQIQNLTDVLQQTVAAPFATEEVASLTAYYSGPQGKIIRRNMEQELRSRGYNEDEVQRIVQIRLRLRQTLNGAIAGIIEDFNNAFGKYLTNTNIAGSASNFLSRFILQIQRSITEFDKNVDIGRPDALRVFVKQISSSLVNLIDSLESEFENNEDIQVITESIGNVVSKMVQKIFVSTTQIVGQIITESLVELPGITRGLVKASLKIPNRVDEIFDDTSKANDMNRYLLTFQNGQISYGQTITENNIIETNLQDKTTQSLRDFGELVNATSDNLRQFNNVLILFGTALTPGGLIGKSAAFLGLSSVSGLSQGKGFQDIFDAGLTSYIGYQLTRFVSRNVSNVDGYSKLGLSAGVAAIGSMEYLKAQQGQSITETISNLLMEGSVLAVATSLDKFKNRDLRTRFKTGYKLKRSTGASLFSALKAGAGAALAGVLAFPFKHPLALLAVAGISFLGGVGLHYFNSKKEEEKVKEKLEQVRNSMINSIDLMLESMSQQARNLVTSDKTFYAKIKKIPGINDKIQEVMTSNVSRQIPVIATEQFRGKTQAIESSIFGDLELDIKPETIFQTFQTIVKSVSKYTNYLVRLLQNAAQGEMDASEVKQGINQLQSKLVDVRNQIYRQLLIQNPNISGTQANDVANKALALMIRNINEAAKTTIERNARYLRNLHSLYSQPGIVEKLFRVSNPILEMPQLKLDLTGNIEQQIKAFTKKVDDTISKGIDDYLTNLNIAEENFTFGDKLQQELDNLNEKINSTLDSLFNRITSTGRKLGFITPEQEYQTVEMREILAQRTAQTNPEQAIRMLLSISQDYYKLGDIQNAFRTFRMSQQLITRVPGEMTEDFQRRYLLNAPSNVRRIPREYLKIAQNVAEYDPQTAIKYAQKASQISRRYADVETYEQSTQFLHQLLMKRAHPVMQLMEMGGRTEYIRKQILSQTSPETIKRTTSRELSLLQQIDSRLKQSLGNTGRYNFPLTRQAVVEVDSAISSKIRGAAGLKSQQNISGATEQTLKDYLSSGNKEMKTDLTSLDKLIQGFNQPIKITDEINKAGKKVTENGETVYRLGPMKVQHMNYETQLPDVQGELNKISNFSNQMTQKFADMVPESLWKPSTSDSAIRMTQSFLGNEFGITPITRPISDSINFFGIQSSKDILPNVDIPRDIFIPVNQDISMQKMIPETDIFNLNQSGVAKQILGNQKEGIIQISAQIVNIQT